MANPTTNYSFAMPTNTDLVKDLPADFDIFGQAVDDRIKALNPETTAGDISYRGSTANAKTRLAIGTAGQVLQVNSGATAPEWATLGGGNKTIALIASGSMPAASSLSITGITQDFLQLQIFGLKWNSGQSRIQMQVNTNTGSIYRQTSFSNISGGGDQINGLSTQIDFNTSGAYNDYGDTWYSITIQNCATAGYKNYQYLQFSKNSGNNFFITGAGQGVIETSVALTSIQIINSNAYNYNAGTYRLVGG